jgi:hypothetical protein
MSLDGATPQDWNNAASFTRLRTDYPAIENSDAPSVSDGSTASYYELPSHANELQDLISFKSMNAQIGEIFRAAYRYGEVAHSKKLRDAKKIKFYADAEIKRLEAGGQ